MKFLQNVLASLVALFIFSGLGFLFMIALAGIMTADKKTSISENSILHLRLKKPIAERSIEDPFAGFSIHSSGATGILDLKEAIQHAKDDENITGITLILNLLWLDLAMQKSFGMRWKTSEVQENLL